MDLTQIKERIVALGVKKLDKKLSRLEDRRFFFFVRLRFLALKLKFLENL